MLSGYPCYFGSLLLSLSLKKRIEKREKVTTKYVIPRNEDTSVSELAKQSPPVAPHSNLKKINTRKVIARNEATTRSKSNLKKLKIDILHEIASFLTMTNHHV